MATNWTPLLKLNVPAFNQDPWDQDVNNNWYSLDAAVGRFFGIANMQGVWLNATAYTAGQSVVDSTDGSMWTCVIGHTSSAAPTTFAQDRTNHFGYWTKILASAADFAAQAQTSATAATASATAAQTAATNAANSAAVVAGALPLSGGTMTGLVILSGDPTNALGAATKQYVDARVGGTGFLPLTGGTLTGPLILQANPLTALGAATKQYVDGFLPLGGGTLTGTLTGTAINLSGNLAANGVINAGASYSLTGSGYQVTTDTTNTYIFMAGNYRWQVNKSSGVIYWIRGTDGAALFTIATDGSASCPANFTAASHALVTGGGRWTSDANYTYIFMDTNNWNFLYTRANGRLDWRNGAGTSLFYCDPTGNFYTAGSIGCATVMPAVGTDTNFSLFASGGYRYLQWAAGGWQFAWNASNGLFIYYTAGLIGLVYNTDATFYNNRSWTGGNGAYVNISDAAIKRDIVDCTYGMDTVRAIAPRAFTRLLSLEEYGGEDRQEVGFVAQEIEAHIPEAIAHTLDGKMGVAESMLVAVLWNAVKQLDERVTKGGM